ncbi:MAG: thioredoxin family protein [Desulfurococcales archaeon]|nr:thioredoxin family protein [Desulfurococcales archaeon]
MSDVKELARRLAEELIKRAEFVEKLARDPVPEITRKDFDAIMKENKVVVLYFTADWCGPCISFLETFRDVALTLARPGVVFARVDVDRSYSLADRFSIQHIPTIAIFRDGKLVETILGQTSRDELIRIIKSHMKVEGIAV